MEHIHILKGYQKRLTGNPDTSVIQLRHPSTVALSALDIPYIRPKLFIKINDPVKTGTPLFCDKRNKCIQYLSPGTGRVKNIIFGPRRRLKEVVIDLEPFDEFVEFGTLSRGEIDTTPREKIIDRLQEGGLWQSFRQFPYKDTADAAHDPPMIIVSLNGNDVHSPLPGVLLDKDARFFEFGLKLLSRFSRRIIVTARADSIEGHPRIQKYVTHTVPDIYPAWDPGVVLYHLKTSQEDNQSWCISAEHLILMAKLLENGRYPVERMVCVTRDQDAKPHIITRQGAPIHYIAGNLHKDGIITTGRFNGRSADFDAHLGFFETTINILHSGPADEMFGFIRPGLTKPSLSHSFLSCFSGAPMDLDCNVHGEERACVNCGYCTKICPVDLMPNFIMKALHSNDIEDALSFGLMDCVRCGLCSYTCPSKIELTKKLSDGMDAHFKDKE